MKQTLVVLAVVVYVIFSIEVFMSADRMIGTVVAVYDYEEYTPDQKR